EQDRQRLVRREHVTTIRGLGDRLLGRAEDHLGLVTEDASLPTVPERNGDLRQVLQLPDQDRGHPAGRLPDLVRSLAHLALELDRAIDHTNDTLGIAVETARQGPAPGATQ